MKEIKQKITGSKRGAASFYIVAFSTLILMVVATSFAMVAISEISRSSNDDLSQSAYDSALAGVEDAKVAYVNYRKCKDTGHIAGDDGTVTVTCADIIRWVEQPAGIPEDCKMVGRIVGKIPKTSEESEVVVGASIQNGITTNQAYTCVTINPNVSDYRKSLGANEPRFMLNLQTGDGRTNDVKKIRIKWSSPSNDKKVNNSLVFNNHVDGKIVFPSVDSASKPPVIEAQITQTAERFKMSDFDKTRSTNDHYQTDRATLYLVPKMSSTDSITKISKSEVVKTNNRVASKNAFEIDCNPNTEREFYCMVDIELPSPYNNEDSGDVLRNNDTFALTISLPYQQPNTDVAVELICAKGSTSCGEMIRDADDDDDNTYSVVHLKNTQISIDSTGRANDLYRRIETRLEASDANYDKYGYSYYPLQVTGDDGVKKDKGPVTSEENFCFSWKKGGGNCSGTKPPANHGEEGEWGDDDDVYYYDDDPWY